MVIEKQESRSTCYCEEMLPRKCVYCQEAADREEDRKVCESWNWNCTPSECAQQARQRGWDAKRLESAMKAFKFAPETISQVLYDFET